MLRPILGLLVPSGKTITLQPLSVSFLHLGWSVIEFYKAYKELAKIKDDIKEYKNELETIKKNFNDHKEKLGFLPDDFKESLELIKEVFTLICQDYQNLENLIKKIYEEIQIVNKLKNKSTFGLIGSGILGILGIAGGILARNGNSLWYGVSAVSHSVTAVFHGSVIIVSEVLIADLKKVLAEAKEQKTKILEEMENLLKIMTNMEKGYLAKY